MKNTNSKSTLAAVIAIMALSLFACSDKNNSKGKKVSDTSTTTVTNPVSETKQSKNTTTSATSQTDTDTVTTKMVSDSNSTSVTTTNTEKTKDTTSSNTAISSDSTDISTTASKSTDAPVTTVSSSETTVTTVPTTITEATPPPGVVNSNGILLTWICANKENSLPGNGQLAALTFRIKENTPSGEYYISLGAKNGNNNSAFAKYNGTQKYADFDGGIISVSTGYVAADYDYQGVEIFANLTNAHGNPGDTVTIYADISNNFAGAIGAFTLKLEYDYNALEIVSIEQGTIFDYIEKGTFASNIDNDLGETD
ncbi:MAG: hypothetical protein IJP18_07755 [Oscillospiraceae bacterium]|nr:hypothetical protein [Oscillospiraceae bacterium]